jgi:hypothetical protein
MKRAVLVLPAVCGLAVLAFLAGSRDAGERISHTG